MKNVTTFETAAALKAAGFPQPEPEAGQVWYESERLVFVCVNCGEAELIAAPVHCVDWSHKFGSSAFGEKCFAPTAANILLELPDGVNLSRWDGIGEGIVWQCEYIPTTPPIKPVPFHYNSTNPAEACAAAWLALNRKE